MNRMIVVVWAITTVTALRYDNACKLTLDKLYVLRYLPPRGFETPHDGRERFNGRYCGAKRMSKKRKANE